MEDNKGVSALSGYKISLMALFYPTEGFPAIKKDRKKFNAVAPTMILFFVLFSKIGKLFVTHYPLTTVNILDVNFFQEVFGFLVVFLLWVLANYYVTCIYSGEVKLREVYAAVCYAFLPYAVLTLPIAYFTNVLDISSAGLIGTLNSIIMIWVGLLIFIGIREMNSYSIPETIKVVFVSVIALLFIAVVAVLLYVLGVKLFGFIGELLKEYRILLFG